MSILEKVRGADALDATLTIKINGERKEELIEFAKLNKLSMGKLIRAGIDMVTDAIKAESKLDKSMIKDI